MRYYSAAIPLYEPPDLTPLLEDLVSQTLPPRNILLIVNSAPSEQVSRWRKNFPVDVQMNPRNLGFAVAGNQAAEWCTEEWLWLLNQDVRVPHDAAEKLLAVADGIAVASGSLWQGKVLESAGHAFFTDAVARNIRILPPEDGWWEVWGVPATAALYHLPTLRRLPGNLFDPAYFAYLEDVDLNLRLRLHGLRAAVRTEVRIQHAGGRRDLAIRRRAYGNYLYFLRKFRGLIGALFRWEDLLPQLARHFAEGIPRGWLVADFLRWRVPPYPIPKEGPALVGRWILGARWLDPPWHRFPGFPL